MEQPRISTSALHGACARQNETDYRNDEDDQGKKADTHGKSAFR
jgi:hypothetical protein